MKIGDQVTWTHSYKKGRSYSFTARTGKIVAINGTNITARYKGQNYTGHMSRFRPVGQTNELTDMVMKRLNPTPATGPRPDADNGGSDSPTSPQGADGSEGGIESRSGTVPVGAPANATADQGSLDEGLKARSKGENHV